MNIKELLAKVAKGESLADDEKAFLATFDPDKIANSSAAAARKEAEKQRDALKAQLAELEGKLEEAGQVGKTEAEQLKVQLAKLTKTTDESRAALAKLEAEKRGLIRGAKLDRIMTGLKFVDGVDADLPRMALERMLAEVKDEDLDNEAAVTPIVSVFRDKNKALILDQSGGGAGAPPKDGPGAGAGNLTVAGIQGMDNATFLKQKDAIWAAADKIKQ